ncbi:MCE family protein [Nocardioides massiliensis]|uniref:Virulence factor Mce-like protein n=1 Tax=Nocardioides massiliensis TaxID=1325935 RepID=A0ABT9NS07_9ACTN|nr:MCE family protein [Nocardioides massiliensis]MDP9823210.1 virulence factor Mce-like protein [Nocardioides massiliensis]
MTTRRTTSSWPRRAGVLVSVLAFVASVSGCFAQSSPMQVTAWFDDVAGLFVDNDVAVRGVPVGRVSEITPRGDLVEVTLELDPETSVPADAAAVIANRSVATDRYVELTPADPEGPRLEDGDVIDIDRTRNPVEFDDLLATLEEVASGLSGKKPAQAIRRFLSTSADTLEGTGTTFNETIRTLAGAMDGLSGNRDALTGTVSELDRLTAALASNDETVREFMTSVSDAADLLADERDNIGESLRALSAALGELNTFVRDNRTELRSSLTGLTKVTNSLLKHQSALHEIVEVLPLTMRNVGDAIGKEGPYEDRLNVRLPPTYLVPENHLVREICDALPVRLCPLLGTSPSLQQLLEILGGIGR